MKDWSKSKEQEKAEIQAHLEEQVRALTPEVIRLPENAEHIRKNFSNGAIAMAMFMISDAQENEDEPKDHAFEYAWSFQDFARTILTTPLPVEQVWAHYSENPDEAPLEVVVADETNWWEKLHEGQKEAIFDVLGLMWSAVRDYKPREEDRSVAHTIFNGEDAWVTGEDIEGYRAYPAVIWNPHHGIVITAIPFEETSPDME